MDKIFINDLVIAVNIGVTENERKKPQRICISICLWVDFLEAFRTDEITTTLNYSKVKNRIIEIAGGSNCCLLESLGFRILDNLAEFNIKRGAVTLKKLDVWKNGVPGVTTSRRF